MGLTEKYKQNPTSLLLSSAMMLRYLGISIYADKI